MPATPEPDDPLIAMAAAQRHLQQWRQAHPHATLREIEGEVDRQMAQVRTHLITRAAHQEDAQTRPDCPRCGVAMQRVGTRERRVVTAQDATVTLRGAGYRCPACGAGLFPPG